MLQSFFNALTVPGEDVLFGMDAIHLLYVIGAIAVLGLLIQIGHYLRHHRAGEESPSNNTSAPDGDAAIAAAIAASLAAAEDDGALVAAITAAITAARADAGETGAFRVVSFKRVDQKRRFGR